MELDNGEIGYSKIYFVTTEKKFCDKMKNSGAVVSVKSWSFLGGMESISIFAQIIDVFSH